MVLHDFDDLAWHLRRLRRARQDGRLIFVLGSGINAAYRLPDWSTLIVDLLLNSGRLRKAKALREADVKNVLNEIIRDPLLQAAAVRSAFARPEQWLSHVRDRLSRFKVKEVEDPTKPLGKIASIVAAQYRQDPHRHLSILTFNYDDLMEVALRSALEENTGDARSRHRNPAVQSISREEDFFGSIHRAGIFVYHLHGYIHDAESDIVLDAASYVGILASPGRHWSWHCMNTYLFHQDSAALFLGLSLVDPSLRLLLTQAAARGLSLSGIYVSKPFPPLRRRDTKGVRNMAFAAHDIVELFDDVLRDLSLVPYHVKSWDELPLLLDKVAEE